MDYVGRIYRPPSESTSLLLQVTVGCSHNRCTFCDMYRDKPFRAKPREQVERDLLEARALGPKFSRVFLCDGDALILSTTRLLEVLAQVRRELPWVERVGTYGDTRSVGKKSVAELSELADAGLGIVYHGVESGNDQVLAFIEKGGTRQHCVETAAKLREAGIVHSVIVLLGIGGTRWSEVHARDTASVLTAMDPPYVGALTTTVVPGTPLAAAEARGDFELPSKFGLVRELHTLVEGSELSACRFSSNHASNYLPVRAELPRDKPELLRILSAIIAEGDEGRLKPEWMRGL
ncbi:MAG: radical SAM protein [Myxococcales bacterium]|nr:radical SAM protein [Myxococcales bacterium]